MSALAETGLGQHGSAEQASSMSRSFPREEDFKLASKSDAANLWPGNNSSSQRTSRANQQHKRKLTKTASSSSKRNSSSSRKQQQRDQLMLESRRGLPIRADEELAREPRPQSAVPATRRPRTAQRVRINSTSEQIQDPNWLLQMVSELEGAKASRSKRTSHLRSLHLKLKSSLTGSHGFASSSASTTQDSGLDSSVQAAAVPGPAVQPQIPPIVPATPVKVPVSILKQPSQQLTPSSNCRPAKAKSTRSAASRANSNSAYNADKPEKPPIAAKTTTRAIRQQHSLAAGNGSHTQRSSPSSSKNEDDAMQPAAITRAATPAAPELRPVPICAGGQVKVSAWKRKNLLAKTLSHLDEIRGNQRPIFVPTKIQLPAATQTLQLEGSKANLAPSSSASCDSSAKFAEVVKAALMASRRQPSLSNNHHDQRPGKTGAPTVTVAAPAGSTSTVPVGAPAGGPLVKWRSAVGSSVLTGKVLEQVDQHLSVAKGTSTGTSVPEQETHSKRSSIGATSEQLMQAGQPHPATQILLPAVAGRTHRSSSTGLATPSVSLTNASTTTSGRAQSAQQQQQTARPHLIAETSARQFKLAHKNQQVLQHLRRLSNEIQAASNSQGNEENCRHFPASSASSQTGGGAGSGHLKDWKRLTSKLALLTLGSSSSGGLSRSVANWANSLPPSSNCSRLLNIENSPLRLTVSNEDTPGSRAGARGVAAGGRSSLSEAQQAHPFKRNSLLLAPPAGVSLTNSAQWKNCSRDKNNHLGRAGRSAGASRKLSSSSMVVVLTGDCESSYCDRLGLGGSSVSPNGPRRSSDSEAYRLAASGSQLQQQQWISRPPSYDRQLSVNNINNNNNKTTSSPSSPLVVNRNDLLQLLKVTTGSVGGSTQARRSLQLDHPAGDSSPRGGGHFVATSTASARVCNHRGRRSSTNSDHQHRATSDAELFDRQLSAGSSGAAAAAPDELVSTDSLVTDSGATPLPSSSQLSAECAQPVSGQRGSGSAGPSESESCEEACKRREEHSAKGSRRRDLSWVVKKTSRVAFFQEKLRKIRWRIRSARSDQQQQRQLKGEPQEETPSSSSNNKQEKSPEIISSASVPKDERAEIGDGEEEEEDNHQQGAPDLLGVDPTLIGDAIEIFLRSAMQSNASEADSQSLRAGLGGTEAFSSNEGEDDDNNNNNIDASLQLDQARFSLDSTSPTELDLKLSG